MYNKELVRTGLSEKIETALVILRYTESSDVFDVVYEELLALIDTAYKLEIDLPLYLRVNISDFFRAE